MTKTNTIKYDLSWPKKFYIEAEKIKGVLGNQIIDVQHIGSTSIPNLLSKPIIDIGVLVNSIDDIQFFVSKLSTLGYEYKPDMSSVERIFLRKGNPIEYHLSIACPKHTFWNRNITFRDYLRRHPDLAKEYGELKTKNLLETPESDFDDLSRSKSYNKGKGDFVQKVLGLAERQNKTSDDRVIFFDCYQTLLDIRLDKENQKQDEQRGWEEFVNLIAKKYGIKIGVSDFINLLEKRKADFYSSKDKTIHHHNLLALISEVLEKDLKSKPSEEKISDLIYEYRKISRGYIKLYPKVTETLARLSEKYTLSIASYTQSSFTQPELKELDIEKYFSYFIFSSDIGFRKESLEFYKKCLQVVGKSPADCVMVGDNYREDISVPSQLGINTIWIKNPDTYSKHPDLPTIEAMGVIDLQEFDRLPEVIDGIFKK